MVEAKKTMGNFMVFMQKLPNLASKFVHPMMKCLIRINLAIFFLSVIPLQAAGQNLVPNPSFEEYEECPEWVGDFTVSEWTKPTWGSTDYFNSCNSGELGVPQNVFGWQYPKSGEAYIGIFGSGIPGGDAREYAQSELVSPLIEGHKYEVGFWISRADSSTSACNNLGVYLSKEQIYGNFNENIPVDPQIVYSGEPITNPIDWIQVVDTFIASGGEQYITIGLFSNDENTNFVLVPGGWEDGMYYYIDDAFIYDLGYATDIHSNEKHNSDPQLLIYPNPTREFITISALFRIIDVNIYSLDNRKLYSITANSSMVKLELSKFSPGIYLLLVTDEKFTYKSKFILTP